MSELKNLDWYEILERLEKLATSQLGREGIQGLEPLPTAELAQDSFNDILSAQNILLEGHRPHMQSLDLFALWHQRLVKGAVLRPLELRDIRLFCAECIALKQTLKSHSSAWSKSCYQKILEASEPLSAIDQLMGPDGEILTDASETLYRLYHERQIQVRQVQNILDKLVKDHELTPVLQERYVTNREGRWVLPVKSGMRHDFEGIIHGSSQSKQTVFMEPKEIIPLNNRIRELDVAIEEEIERLLTELSAYLKTLSVEFELAKETLLRADVRFAQAQLAILMEAQPCEFSEDEIDLEHVRHPLLLLGQEKVVANSVHLGAHKRILLLSGPNAGGKTVLLKAVGLAAHMARCGLPICTAKKAKLPFFKNLHIAVGDSQSVDAHLSTFAAHLQILNRANQAHGSLNLLLIDEICGSTDPEEGSALARSFIESYAEHNVFAVITSHLGPLKLGWSSESGVINGSLEYDMQSGRPTYQFIMGVPGQSLALKTARRVGVDAKLLERALNYLSPDTKKFLSQLDEVEQMKGELRAQLEQSRREQSKAIENQQKYQSELQLIQRDKDKILNDTLREAQRKVNELIQQTKVSDSFKRHEILEKMKVDLPEIIKPSQVTTAQKKIMSIEDFAKAFPPGTKIFAANIGRDAVVQSAPNSKGEVLILSNSMRMQVPWQELKPPAQATNPTLHLVRKHHQMGTGPLNTDRTIDVRGMASDEATAVLERELDAAIIRGEDRVKIVHGHGTDVLKKAVRTYLSRSLYIKKWQAGNADTGGDGVTWAELNED